MHAARIEYALVVLDDLEGGVEFAGDPVVVAFVHDFGCLVFDRVDKLQCGFASRPAFQTRAVNAVPGGVGVLTADELVDEGAAFPAVDELTLNSVSGVRAPVGTRSQKPTAAKAAGLFYWSWSSPETRFCVTFV